MKFESKKVADDLLTKRVKIRRLEAKFGLDSDLPSEDAIMDGLTAGEKRSFRKRLQYLEKMDAMKDGYGEVV